MKVFGAFFDRPAVLNSVSQAERKTLSRAGAFVRRTARSSMRRRKKASQPGQPPSVKQGQLKKFLFFSWDQQTRSLVVGPELLSRRAGAPVPSLMESGGVVRWTKRRTGESRQSKILPRPFMAPALDKNLSALPEAWRNALR